MADLPVPQLDVREDRGGAVDGDDDDGHGHGCHNSDLNRLGCLLLHLALYASYARRLC